MISEINEAIQNGINTNKHGICNVITRTNAAKVSEMMTKIMKTK